MISFNSSARLTKSQFHLAVEIIDELGHIEIVKKGKEKKRALHCL